MADLDEERLNLKGALRDPRSMQAAADREGRRVVCSSNVIARTQGLTHRVHHRDETRSSNTFAVNFVGAP